MINNILKEVYDITITRIDKKLLECKEIEDEFGNFKLPKDLSERAKYLDERINGKYSSENYRKKMDEKFKLERQKDKLIWFKQCNVELFK